MKLIRSYVVRIYRKDRHGTAGVVEDVCTGNSRSFRSAEEPWSALSRRGLRSPGTDPESDDSEQRDPMG